jgi:hypothetical protein
MKKIWMVAGLAFFAAALAFIVTHSYNNTSGKLVMQGLAMQADGSPIPPLPPHYTSGEETLVADGSPIPPLPPHYSEGAGALGADGSPIPPLPPHFDAIGAAA